MSNEFVWRHRTDSTYYLKHSRSLSSRALSIDDSISTKFSFIFTNFHSFFGACGQVQWWIVDLLCITWIVYFLIYALSVPRCNRYESVSVTQISDLWVCLWSRRTLAFEISSIRFDLPITSRWVRVIHGIVSSFPKINSMHSLLCLSHNSEQHTWMTLAYCTFFLWLLFMLCCAAVSKLTYLICCTLLLAQFKTPNQIRQRVQHKF